MQYVVDHLRYNTLDQPFVEQLEPYHHQAKTLEEVRNAIVKNNSVAIINSSVTGSGKTLANFASTILDRIRTIGVYPTNELIRDQEAALRKHLGKLDIVRVDSERLDGYREQMQVRSNTETLATITADWEDYHALLTNPDILHLMAFDLYGYSSRINMRERLFQALINNFPVIAFDEFHLYDTKQVGNVAFIVGTIARLAPDKPHVFIFSSATPQGIYEWAYQRLNIPVINVTTEPTNEGRIVSEPLQLNLYKTNLGEWKSGQKIVEQLWDDIEAYLDQYPSARGIFVLDSVYEAKLLALFLSEKFGEDNVGEVHGYMDSAVRRDGLKCRFSVGTTTIDVGVDFQDKDFMVFEARSGAQFIQRIGRLGRRGREPNTIKIPNQAWALIPHYVYNYVQDATASHLHTQPIKRRDILEHIDDGYTPKEKFEHYWGKYSPLEAMAAKERIKSAGLTNNREKNDETLSELIIDLYQPIEPITGIEERQRKTWYHFGQVSEHIKKPQPRDRYLPEIESFRGSSYFQVALYDRLDEQKGWFPFKIYSLPFVLRRTQFNALSGDKFEGLLRAKTSTGRADSFLRRAKRSSVLGYLQINDLSSESNRIHFAIPKKKLLDKHEQPIRLDRWEIRVEGELHHQLKSINKALRKRKLIAWYCQSPPWEMAHYNLPTMFQTYALSAYGSGKTDSFWTVAFGLNAFLLDCTRKNTDTPYFG